ncbi:MAG: rhomboid family intramembrane serine protease [Verrucomicrobiota bacterium]
MKHRLQRSFLLLRNASSTWKIIAILLAFQCYFTLLDELPQKQLFFGLSWLGLSEGKFFELFTYILIHGSWTHLGLNLAAILILGSKLEYIIPKLTLELLATHAALAGGLMFLLLSPSNQTLVGSSPICFAFLLMLLTLSPESKFLPFFLSGKTLGIAIILANFLLALLNPDLPTGPIAKLGQGLENRVPKLFEASHACHLGGSLVGWIYGIYMLRPRISLKTLQQRRNR